MKYPMVINPHDGENICYSSNMFYNNQHFVTTAFIDPGIVNCGIRIATLDFISLSVSTVYMDRITFNQTRDLVNGIQNSYNIIQQLLPLLIETHYIVFETQIPYKAFRKGKRVKQGSNMENYRFSQHLISTISLSVKNRGFNPLIVEIPSYLKTRGLNAPPLKIERERKEWCKQAAKSILESRGDEVGLNILLKNKRKMDDVADTVCYDEVWWPYLNNHPEIKKPSNWKMIRNLF